MRLAFQFIQIEKFLTEHLDGMRDVCWSIQERLATNMRGIRLDEWKEIFIVVGRLWHTQLQHQQQQQQIQINISINRFANNIYIYAYKIYLAPMAFPFTRALQTLPTLPPLFMYRIYCALYIYMFSFICCCAVYLRDTVWATLRYVLPDCQ